MEYIVILLLICTLIYSNRKRRRNVVRYYITGKDAKSFPSLVECNLRHLLGDKVISTEYKRIPFGFELFVTVRGKNNRSVRAMLRTIIRKCTEEHNVTVKVYSQDDLLYWPITKDSLEIV